MPESRIAWNQELSAWTVWRYKDIIAVLEDRRFSAQAANNLQSGGELPSPQQGESHRHTFVKGLQEHMEWIRDNMQQQATAFCPPQQDMLPLDLQQDLIQPWCESLGLILCGIPEKSKEAAALLILAKEVFQAMSDDTKREKAQEATSTLAEYFSKRLARASKHYGEDLTSVLGRNSDDPRLISWLIQLFLGMTTSLPLLLGNILFTLLSAPPEVRRAYLAKPDLSTQELLRIAGPAQWIYRLALQDVCMAGGHTFKKGDRLALLLSQGNRDPLQFPEPDSLQLLRKNGPHLSLGKGAHACLGSPIIREACQILPVEILKQMPDFRVSTGAVRWGGSKAIWGVVSLPGSQAAGA